MAIPFIQAPALQSTPLNQATPSAQALAGPAQSFGDVARGIAQVGNAFAAQAERVQKLENARLESEARTSITAELSDFEQRMANATDPGMMLPELEKTIERTSAIADNPNLPPVVRDRLLLWHNETASRAKLSTASNAGRLSLKRAGLALQNELDMSVQQGDDAAFEDVLNRGMEAGLLLPEEAQEKRMKFSQTQTYNSLAQEAQADPQAFLDSINTPEFSERAQNLTETNKSQLVRWATKLSNEQKAQTWEQIQIASLEGRILSREELMTMAKEGDITATQAGSYLRTYHGGAAPEFDADIFDNLRDTILSYDPKTDETGERRAIIATELATAALPKEAIGELQKQFAARQQKPEASKHALATEYHERIKAEWAAEGFGDWFDQPTEPNAARKIRAQDYDAALSYRMRFENKFMTWLDQQPDDLDPVEAGKAYDRFKSEALAEQSPVDVTTPTLAPPPMFEDPAAPAPMPDTEPEGVGADGSPGVLPPPEGPRTSFRFRQPLKLSNYGYKSDTTPDHFSKHGIGHNNNQLVDGVSAAVTKSLADSLGLKSGDWFIAKTTKGDLRVRYDGTVPDSDPRTGPLPPTIDIYRKTKGSNSWSGKVLGIEKIDPPEKVSDVRSEKARAFATMPPSTPEAAQFLIDQIHTLHNLSYTI